MQPRVHAALVKVGAQLQPACVTSIHSTLIYIIWNHDRPLIRKEVRLCKVELPFLLTAYPHISRKLSLHQLFQDEYSSTECCASSEDVPGALGDPQEKASDSGIDPAGDRPPPWHHHQPPSSPGPALAATRSRPTASGALATTSSPPFMSAFWRLTSTSSRCASKHSWPAWPRCDP